MRISPMPKVPNVADEGGVVEEEEEEGESGKVGVEDGMNLWVVMMEGV